MAWKSKKLRIAIIAMGILFIAWICTALFHTLADKYDSLAAAICALAATYFGANVGSSLAYAKIVEPPVPDVAAPLTPSTVTILTGEKKD